MEASAGGERRVNIFPRERRLKEEGGRGKEASRVEEDKKRGEKKETEKKQHEHGGREGNSDNKEGREREKGRKI